MVDRNREDSFDNDTDSAVEKAGGAGTIAALIGVVYLALLVLMNTSRVDVDVVVDGGPEAWDRFGQTTTTCKGCWTCPWMVAMRLNSILARLSAARMPPGDLSKDLLFMPSLGVPNAVPLAEPTRGRPGIPGRLRRRLGPLLGGQEVVDKAPAGVH